MARSARLEEAVDDPDEAAGDGRRSQPVDAAVRAHHATLGDQPRYDDQREGRDRQVDEEDPAPGHVVDEDAGDDRARRAAEPGDAAPDPERLDPLARVHEQHRDQAERGRRGERLTESLGEPADDEHRRVLRDATGQRGSGEQRHPDEEQLAATEDVSEATTQEKEPAGGQDVTVDHPGQAGAGEAEARLDVRQRDVHDGDVEDEHELDQREHRERLPPARIRRIGRHETEQTTPYRHPASGANQLHAPGLLTRVGPASRRQEATASVTKFTPRAPTRHSRYRCRLDRRWFDRHGQRRTTGPPALGRSAGRGRCRRRHLARRGRCRPVRQHPGRSDPSGPSGTRTSST